MEYLTNNLHKLVWLKWDQNIKWVLISICWNGSVKTTNGGGGLLTIRTSYIHHHMSLSEIPVKFQLSYHESHINPHFLLNSQGSVVFQQGHHRPHVHRSEKSWPAHIQFDIVRPQAVFTPCCIGEATNMWQMISSSCCPFKKKLKILQWVHWMPRNSQENHIRNASPRPALDAPGTLSGTTCTDFSPASPNCEEGWL